MLQPLALTTPRPDVGRALATLAKRCARALGSGRRPRRHVGTNTTPRFCVHHGPRRHLRWPDVLACARERKVAGHGGSVERTQGAGVRSASAAPPWASGVRPGSSARCGCLLPQVVPSRPDHPSAPHVQDISRAATQAKRATADAEAPRCVWAHTAPRPPIRAELRGASFGVHRLLAALLQPALCQAEHMGRAAAQAARATPTAGLRAASARALVHQSSRHHHHDQREGRWGRQEPQIALSAHLRTWHSAPHR